MTDFQKLVLEKVADVPRGRVTTYKALAKEVGRPKAWRAVANAVAGNPHPVDVPCHRVVRSDGRVGGYQSGFTLKAKLLENEGVRVERERVDLNRFLFRF